MMFELMLFQSKGKVMYIQLQKDKHRVIHIVAQMTVFTGGHANRPVLLTFSL